MGFLSDRTSSFGIEPSKTRRSRRSAKSAFNYFCFRRFILNLNSRCTSQRSSLRISNLHASSHFEFSRGTTAITGENGAGKTTIIEAIAWVLFDLLEYKKEDFVRRGERKALSE